MTEERKRRVIAALITSPTKAEACKVLKIDPRTLYNYMQDTDFMDDYKSAINGVIDESIAGLKVTMAHSATALDEIIANKDEPTEIRLKAIKIALDSCIRLSEKAGDIKTSVLDSLLDF